MDAQVRYLKTPDLRLRLIVTMGLIRIYAVISFRCSLHQDVRGGEEDRHRGDDGEGGEDDQTEAVDHHGSKLPV